MNYEMWYYQAFSQGLKRGRPILVQRYIYSKEGRGSRKRSSGKPLKFMFISVSVPSLFEIFHLAL
jgi:hypothetical protein